MSSATTEKKETVISQQVSNSDFVQEPAPKPLRVCCYGSSSSLTPQPYMDAAQDVGYILARRGHTCVNGAGSFGCMAAMNDGAAAGNGHIVGVIHSMWLVDSSDWGVTLRDGGAHSVFHGKDDDDDNDEKPKQSHGGPHPALKGDPNVRDGPVREMLVAGGKDLQERKRLLVDKADALIVLPGGPGTWDELWEMACARNIGLTKLPIVCVNVDNYYEPFKVMLERAWKDKLTKLAPHEILHFEDTAQAAVKWVEAVQSVKGPATALKKRTTALRSESVLSSPVVGKSNNSPWLQSMSVVSEYVADNKESFRAVAVKGALFGAGIAAGVVLAGRRSSVSR